MKTILLIILSIYITSCAKVAEKYGLYKLSNEEKIAKLISNADGYNYNGKSGKGYKDQLLSLTGENDLNEAFKIKLLDCYNINNISFSGDEQCTIEYYISEINSINSEKEELRKKEKELKREKDLISRSLKKDFNKDYENHLYFCNQSYILIESIINDILMKRGFDQANKFSMGVSSQKYENQSAKTFQYKILQITPNQLNSLEIKLKSILPKNIDLFNRQEVINQSNYFSDCLSSPKNYIFNYDLIFK